MNRSLRAAILGILILTAPLGLTACSSLMPLTPVAADEKRAEVRSMAKQTLAQVYELYPEARRKVEEAHGYAVFSDFGLKFLYMGSATGSGLAIDNANKKPIYMKMVELQPGYGFGVQNFRVVFIFETREAFNQFVNSGWEFGGTSTAALQTTTQGVGAGLGVSVSSGVVMYQISESGAIVGVSVTGAKYYRDDQLN